MIGVFTLKKVIFTVLALVTLTLAVNLDKAFAEAEAQPGPFSIVNKVTE
ncbi:Uncharacterised protein [Mycobacteroides abscessus subsp. abscessus]|jgi:hypothetical protein|nr:Uncharacterised protein [Mycobacteroides abscessus subsp. abscessus]